MSTRKTSFSLPEELLAELDLVASHLSISRSALVSALLAPVMPQYVSMCGRTSVYDSPVPRRFTVSRQHDIQASLEMLQVGLEGTQGELFKE